MSSIRREAINALARQLASYSGLPIEQVFSVHADQEKNIKFPSIAIVAGRWSYEWFSDDELATDDDIGEEIEDAQLVSIGTLTGIFEVRIYEQTAGKRELLEEKVIRAFMDNELAPGVLTATCTDLEVSGQAIDYEADASFVLGDTSWSEERVFERARYSFLDVTCEVPIMVLREGIYTILELQLQLTKDLDTDNDDPVIDDSVIINSDGSVTPN